MGSEPFNEISCSASESGNVRDWRTGMIARTLDELIAWQLARQLQREVLAIVANEAASRDFKFCDQIRDAARSVANNTAEGFARGRLQPADFRQFLRFAAGSLYEVRTCLDEAVDRGFISAAQHEQLIRLVKRAFKANTRLQAYLRTCRPRDRT